MSTSMILIAVSTLLAMVSPMIYARSIVAGEARPHRTTRIILLINTVLATLSLYAQHDTVAIWLAGISTLQAVIVFLLSLRYGMGGWTKIDFGCLLIALSGIVLWKTTNNPIIGLYAAIFSDFVGMVPTIIKTYKKPETEIWQFWTIDTFAGLLNLLAVRSFITTQFAYPLYIMLVNSVVAALLLKDRILENKGEKNK